MRQVWLALLVLPSLAGAQQITLKFGTEGERYVDVASSPTAKLNLGEPITTATHQLEASGDQWVRVYDAKTGNLAARQASDIHSGLSRSVDVSGRWTFFDSDYKRIGILRVRADQGGKPLALGAISIGSQTEILTPENKGSVVFYGVPLGKVRVSVSYRDGADTRTVAQGFDVPAVRDLPEPELVVAVPASQSAPVGGPTKTNEGQLPPAKSAAPPRGFLGNLVAIIITSGAALALLYFGLRWIYGNQDKAKDTLTKLGVQVPDPVADPTPDPDAVPYPIHQPSPITPIILDPVAPPAAAPLVISAEPALVGTAGRFTLTEGVHIIGREAGLTIALVGETNVSRRHAEIVRNGTSMVIRDLGSTNGTFVNGVKIDGDQELRPGDRVQFGSVGFVIE